MVDLTLALKVDQCADRILDRYPVIDRMQLVELDAFEPQPSQAVCTSAAQMIGPGAGYLQNIVQMLQAGVLVYSPASGQISKSPCYPSPCPAAPPPPPAYNQSPFVAGATDVAPVYTQPQAPAAQVIASYLAANPTAPPIERPAPVVVQPSPAAQPASSGTSSTAPGSAVSVANGAAAPAGGTVNAGSSPASILPAALSDIPAPVWIGAAAVALFWFFSR